MGDGHHLHPDGPRFRLTVDTAIAHLAGALGVRTFLLLRYTSDWRWFDKGRTSPWYPSLTLFRQPAPNRWDDAIEEMATALQTFVDTRQQC